MIKLETHCHSLGANVCPKSPPEQIIEDYLNAGYGGAISTNHYSKGAFETFPEGDDLVKAKYFLSLIHDFKEKGAKKGFKVFNGIEVRLSYNNQEFMIIGFEDKFLLDNCSLYTYTQEQLFEVCCKAGVLMSQTHPKRSSGKHKVIACDPKFLHATETFNGHFHHVNNNDDAEKFASENNLIKLSGTDYHEFGQPITAGIYIPEEIDTEKQLLDYLFKGDFKRIENKELYLETMKKWLEYKQRWK